MWRGVHYLNTNKGVAIGIGDNRRRYLRNSHYFYPSLVLKWVESVCLVKSQPQGKTPAISQGISSPLENHKYWKVKHLVVFSLCLIVCALPYVSKYLPKHQFRCRIIVARKYSNDTHNCFALGLALTNWGHHQDLLKDILVYYPFPSKVRTFQLWFYCLEQILGPTSKTWRQYSKHLLSQKTEEIV